MVAAQDHRSFQLSAADGLVEGQGNLGAAFAVGIQDAGLGTHHQMVAAGFLNPADVVPHLAGNLFGGMGGNLAQHAHGNLVGLLQVGRFFAHAHPAEGTEAIVEVHGPHDVLHIGRVAEATVGQEDIGPCTGALQEEGVAVVEEVHAVIGQFVDGGHLTAQGFLHGAAEGVGVIGHHFLGLFQGIAHRVVTARPGVVQGGLVAAQIHVDMLGRQALPKVYDVAYIGQGNHFLGSYGFPDAGDKLVQIGMQFIHPALRVTFFGRLGINLGRDAHHSGNVTGLGLCAGHAAQTCCHKQFSGRAATLFARRIHHRNGGAVHYALRTNVHIGAGRHLAVLRDAQGVETLPVVRF